MLVLEKTCYRNESNHTPPQIYILIRYIFTPVSHNFLSEYSSALGKDLLSAHSGRLLCSPVILFLLNFLCGIHIRHWRLNITTVRRFCVLGISCLFISYQFVKIIHWIKFLDQTFLLHPPNLSIQLEQLLLPHFHLCSFVVQIIHMVKVWVCGFDTILKVSILLLITNRWSRFFVDSFN